MNRIAKIVIVLLICGTASAVLVSAVDRYALKPNLAREDVLTAYKAGQLKADSTNTIVLPDKWAIASEDGKAYLRIDDQNISWILFVTKHNGKTFSGYLACPTANKSGNHGMVDVNYPPAGGLVTVKVSRMLSPWYYEVASKKP